MGKISLAENVKKKKRKKSSESSMIHSKYQGTFLISNRQHDYIMKRGSVGSQSSKSSVRDNKVSPSVTVSGIPPGCTLLSLHRLESDSSWSEALEGNGSFSQMIFFTALGHKNNMQFLKS